jgi:hypothetical protein
MIVCLLACAVVSSFEMHKVKSITVTTTGADIKTHMVSDDILLNEVYLLMLYYRALQLL